MVSLILKVLLALGIIILAFVLVIKGVVKENKKTTITSLTDLDEEVTDVAEKRKIAQEKVNQAEEILTNIKNKTYDRRRIFN